MFQPDAADGIDDRPAEDGGEPGWSHVVDRVGHDDLIPDRQEHDRRYDDQ